MKITVEMLRTAKTRMAQCGYPLEWVEGCLDSMASGAGVTPGFLTAMVVALRYTAEHGGISESLVQPQIDWAAQLERAPAVECPARVATEV